MSYLQAENPPHSQAHLVFPTRKANAKKPKELALHTPTENLRFTHYFMR